MFFFADVNCIGGGKRISGILFRRNQKFIVKILTNQAQFLPLALYTIKILNECYIMSNQP